MSIIGIISLSPNAGAKTVSANLAYELSSEASPCLAIDACDANLLRLHFGMPLSDERGAGENLTNIFSHPSSVHYLPYGKRTSEQTHPLCLNMLEQFKERINGQFSGYHKHIVNLGHLPLTQWKLLESQFSLILCVIEPQPLTYAYLHKLNQFWDRIPQNFKFIINKVSYTEKLNQEVTQLIRFELSETLISPVLIRLDQNIPEALATQQPVNDYAPASQGAADFNALSLWVKGLQ